MQRRPEMHTGIMQRDEVHRHGYVSTETFWMHTCHPIRHPLSTCCIGEGYLLVSHVLYQQLIFGVL